MLSGKAEWKHHANEERDYRFQHGTSLYQQGSGVKLGSERKPQGEHSAVVVRGNVSGHRGGPDFMAATQLCGEIAHGENLQYLAGVYEFV